RGDLHSCPTRRSSDLLRPAGARWEAETEKLTAPGIPRWSRLTSTNQARHCLASEIGRDRACSVWYGRKQLLPDKVGLIKLTWLGTCRQIGRQTHRQTHKQTDKHTNKKTKNKARNRHTDRQTDRQTDRLTDRQKERKKKKNTKECSKFNWLNCADCCGQQGRAGRQRQKSLQHLVFPGGLALQVLTRPDTA